MYISDRIKPDLKIDLDIDSMLKVKHWRIDRNHSNLYTVYKELGEPTFPNPIQID